MKIVVLSNINQFKAFSALFDIKEFTVFCDNARFRSYLEKKSINYIFLNDYLIPGDIHKIINSWSSGRASSFIRLCQDNRIFKNFDFASHVFLRFSYYLADTVKNYLYAKLIIEKYNPSLTVVFKINEKLAYPKYSGNILLNDFLAECCAQENIKIHGIPISFMQERIAQPLPLARLKEKLRKILSVMYGKCIKPQKDTVILARGALRHLASIVKFLRRRGTKIAFFDFEFRLKSFKFAILNHIPYYIPQSFNNKVLVEEKSFINCLMDELNSALDRAALSGLFIFESYDFGRVIKTRIFSNMHSYYKMLSRWANNYKNLLNRFNPYALLLDEDTTISQSFLAVFFKAEGKKVFCLSHANMVVNFSVPEDSKHFAISTTFVNSEFEKRMYVQRGWDPAMIQVTGTTRFDNHLKFRRNFNSFRNGKLRMLYIGTSMRLFWPERTGYVGHQINDYADFQAPSLKIILEAMQGLPVELTIKPHNFRDKVWYDFFKDHKINNRVQIKRGNASFVDLLADADVVISSYCSTAVIEAAICGIPVILVNLFNSDLPREYAEAGICKLVYDEEGLRHEIEKLCSDLARNKAPQTDIKEQSLEYFLGRRDGNNNQRVCDYILNSIP